MPASRLATPGTGSLAGWTVTYVRAGGLNLRVARRGEGPALLLLTGIGANVEMWTPLVRLLDDRELIAVDAPGTGLSQRPLLPLRMGGLARTMVALLDELGLPEVDVLGYSFGGLLAQELAHLAPTRVRRLILCAIAQGTFVVPPRPVPALLLLTPARYYHPRLFRLITPHIAGGRTRREPEALERQAAARLARPPDLLGYAYQLYASCWFTSLPWLHRIRPPTLILAGDDDPIIPVANPRLMARLLPDADLRVVPGAGHLFLLDEPERVIGEIRAFLARGERTNEDEHTALAARRVGWTPATRARSG
ncbi:MAG TPA: alpha/beta fold hydrolase [Solirubrobacteraceae bacterium]|jgi:poly(3-hydroxyalkanoate) depolymerase|nr:alpha/beta fold hydrolase [Solirubrobacteraceae bacterium]